MEDISADQGRSAAFVVRALNDARAALGLKRVRHQDPRKVTREIIHKMILEVWARYPGALDKENFELGEFTLETVRSEVEQMISDRRRGVNVKKVGFVRTPFDGKD